MGFFGFKIVRAGPKRDPEAVFISFDKRLADLELKIGKLESHIISLRGFVNKKLDLPGEEENLKEPGAIEDGLNALRQK